MTKTIAALTTHAPIYPGYFNATQQDDDSVFLTVRGDPRITDGVHICGYERDRGQPGRCTPGDENCNNYCNLAPQKGPMADRPLDCKQTLAGETVTVRLSAEEWAALVKQIVPA